MDESDASTWVEYLAPEECWRLLAITPVGRVGVLVNSAPEIYPVNHRVDGETVVFRTDPGTKLAGLARSPAVCFQVDGIDADDHTGWSVLVKGRADQLRDPEERERVTSEPLEYWSVGAKAHWIRIVPEEVSGRRIRHGSEDDAERTTAART
ncbi:MAG TPA: pyridoxamine 5'-phosphate oxidase family protein [Acidimicrobiales bacterium]|nr:pyridoxamine 5'-phosphate oxidase family protein [Acidimicrobiales bacterium]